MLAPQSNASRTILDFSGVWDFRLKPDAPWQSIAVPASYNDQSADPEFRRHVGLAWYRRSITVPSMLKGQRLMLRFDAVTHNARVFLDGQLLCTHRGGFLPFEADVTDILHPGQTALLEVEVDNTISNHTLPVGNEGGTAFFGSDNPGIPSVEAGKQHQHEQGINLPNFDFFNYAGLNRPVRLYTTPADYIADVTLIPSMDGTVRYTIVTHGEGDVTLDVLDADGQVVASGTGASGEVHVQIRISGNLLPACRTSTPRVSASVRMSTASRSASAKSRWMAAASSSTASPSTSMGLASTRIPSSTGVGLTSA